MSLGGSIRRWGFGVADSFRFAPGTRIVEQWNEIEQTLADFTTGWGVVQSSLRACLDYATRNSAYYRGFEGRELSEFPVLNKMDYLAHYEQIRTPEFRNGPVWTMSTSGSTGTPFRVVQNMAKRNRVLAELKYFGALAGYESHEKMRFFRSRPAKRFWSSFWSNVWPSDVASFSASECERMYHEQADPSLRGILAYASTYDVLTRVWEREQKVGNPSVRAVFSISSMLEDCARERAIRFWPNAKVVSRYSNQENGILAQETGTPNVFRLNWASYYFEVLKFDSDEPAVEGEQGRIVITDMFNRALPMIRYDNGDVGSLRRSAEGWLQLENLAGRRVDLVYDTRGEAVSPHALTRSLSHMSCIRQWQFMQEGPKAYVMKYLLDRTHADSAASLASARAAIQALFGEDAAIEWREVDEIPVLASNKRRLTVQNWKK